MSSTGSPEETLLAAIFDRTLSHSELVGERCEVFYTNERSRKEYWVMEYPTVNDRKMATDPDVPDGEWEPYFEKAVRHNFGSWGEAVEWALNR
jgi:hypothetical protein